MSPCPAPHRSRIATRRKRLTALIAAVTFLSVSCGSSEPKTQVLGHQEGRQTADETAIEVELLDPVCITNTPAHDPC